MKLVTAFLVVIVLLQFISSGESKSIKQKVSEMYNKTVAKIKEKINNFKQESIAFFDKAKEKLNRGFAAIKNKIKDTVKEKALKLIFKQLLYTLENARQSVKEANEIADEKFYKAMEEAHDQLFEVTSQIDQFLAAQKMKLEDKQEKEKGLEILDDFVLKSAESVKSCSDGVLEPVKELYDLTKIAVDRGLDKLESVINSALKCLDKGGNVRSCAEDTYEEGQKQLKDMGDELMDMKTKLLGTAMNEASSFVCISKTRAGVEMDKMRVVEAIESLH